MEHIDYFKLQAKNLLKDFITRFPDSKKRTYSYKPRFFDLDRIFSDFDLCDYKESFTFTLMNAQQIIANLAGFRKWNELISAFPKRLELAHLLYDNAHKISIEEWEIYVSHIQQEKGLFSDSDLLEIFKKVILEGQAHKSNSQPYRFDLLEKYNAITEDNLLMKSSTFNPVLQILPEDERLKVIKNSGDFTLDSTVQCFHCGKIFRYRESKVIRDSNGFIFIMCKHHPECDGTLMDFIQPE